MMHMVSDNGFSFSAIFTVDLDILTTFLVLARHQ
jgi:hypothetical protein